MDDYHFGYKPKIPGKNTWGKFLQYHGKGRDRAAMQLTL
jgi:hypothetical protein